MTNRWMRDVAVVGLSALVAFGVTNLHHGPTGNTGPAGPAGPAGARGPVGPQGVAGVNAVLPKTGICFDVSYGSANVSYVSFVWIKPVTLANDGTTSCGAGTYVPIIAQGGN